MKTPSDKSDRLDEPAATNIHPNSSHPLEEESAPSPSLSEDQDRAGSDDDACPTANISSEDRLEANDWVNPPPDRDSFYRRTLYRQLHLLDLPVILPDERPHPGDYRVETTEGGICVEAGGYMCHLPRPGTLREAIVLGMMAGHALGFRRAVQTGTNLLRTLFAEEQADWLSDRWEEAQLSDAGRDALYAMVGPDFAPDPLFPDPEMFPDLLSDDPASV